MQRVRRSNGLGIYMGHEIQRKKGERCNIMWVSRYRKPLQYFYSLGSEILKEVSDAKYLGIQIDNKLDWNKQISTVAARGQSKLAFLNRNLKGCPKKLRDTVEHFSPRHLSR